jgi:hypothetical protein
LAITKGKVAKPAELIEMKSPGGDIVARATFVPGLLKLAVDKANSEAFSQFMRDELPLLMKRFFAREGGG